MTESRQSPSTGKLGRQWGGVRGMAKGCFEGSFQVDGSVYYLEYSMVSWYIYISKLIKCFN